MRCIINFPGMETTSNGYFVIKLRGRMSAKFKNIIFCYSVGFVCPSVYLACLSACLSFYMSV